MESDSRQITGLELLARFIEENPTQKRFAQAVRCSESHLSLILAGKRTPSLRLAKRISNESGGLVPMDSLIEEAAE